MRISDWSSDVCSSDLYLRGEGGTPTLDFRPRQQARQVARFAARLVHEEMLEHRHMLDRAEPGSADRVGGAPRNPELPRQPVGREADHHIFAPAPTLVARARSDEHPSELPSLLRFSYSVFFF